MLKALFLQKIKIIVMFQKIKILIVLRYLNIIMKRRYYSSSSFQLYNDFIRENQKKYKFRFSRLIVNTIDIFYQLRLNMQELNMQEYSELEENQQSPTIGDLNPSKKIKPTKTKLKTTNQAERKSKMNDILKVYSIGDEKAKKYFGDTKGGKKKKEGNEEIRHISQTSQEQILCEEQSKIQFPNEIPKIEQLPKQQNLPSASLGNTESNFSRKSRNESSKSIKANLDLIDNKRELIQVIDLDALEKQRKRQRLLRLERARELLSGKLSAIWLFAIQGQIQKNLKERIMNAYNGIMDDDQYIVPLVQNSWEIKPFLEIQNAYFKIVVSLNNFEDAIRYKINRKVVEFYIFNDQGQKGMSRALEYKAQSPKVKGIFTELQKIVEKAEEQIQDSIQIYRLNNSIELSTKRKKFPSFLKLSGKDKTEATLYRGNLYGAIKLPVDEKQANLKAFIELVQEKYTTPKDKDNIKDYMSIDHNLVIDNITLGRPIIEFYVRQSFYYQILNSMLRTLKATYEFKPCILPFNQTYHSIKSFYQQYLKQHSRKIPSMTLYRGTKLQKKDFNALKSGIFIQMFGFMSTSKSRASAEKFTDKDGYIFVIEVKEREMKKKYQKYDHGFVDINRYNLASSQFQSQQQVLFNALNIYKVTKIDDSGNYIFIHLQYGAIFDILDKPKDHLSIDEKDVLTNYQYCTKMLGEIEDQGDVHLLCSQLQEAQQYYVEKIDTEGQNAHNLFKLANIQKQSGDLEEAQKNVKKSRDMLGEQVDKKDKQTCLKVFSIHSKNAEINIQKEDYLNADQQITKSIEMLDDSNLLGKAKKIRERGQVKFKKGQIREAEKDFQMSQFLLNQLSNQAKEMRKQITQRQNRGCCYYLFTKETREEQEVIIRQELQKILELQRQLSEMREEIEDQLIKINGSLKDVALYVQDKDRYEYCVKKGRAHLINLKERETKDPILKAKLMVMQATIDTYLELAESEKLLNQAISIVQSQNLYDQAVGDYSTILAKLQKKQLQKLTNPSVDTKLDPSNPLSFNQKEQYQIYERCKANFQKAINILLYNNKAKDSPEVITIKNQIGELQFNQNNFKSCEDIIKEVKRDTLKLEHTELSKATVLLSKIAFSRGQLKNSFILLQQADQNLKRVLIKSKENPKYIIIYEQNDVYLELNLFKSKIYQKQLNTDLCLSQIRVLKQKLYKKMEGYESHEILPTIFEEEAEVFARIKNDDFSGFFKRALAMRQKQMGRYNIGNAITYCNYTRYLLMFGRNKEAEDNLKLAIQIFGCLAEGHPIYWIIHFTNGIFSQVSKNYEAASKCFQRSLALAEKKFDSSHISIKKMRLNFAKILLKGGKSYQSLQELQRLDEQVEMDLRQSLNKTQIVAEIDDEKITLKKLILKELASINERQTGPVSMIETRNNKYGEKYDQLRQSFRLLSN